MLSNYEEGAEKVEEWWKVTITYWEHNRHTLSDILHPTSHYIQQPYALNITEVQ